MQKTTLASTFLMFALALCSLRAQDGSVATGPSALQPNNSISTWMRGFSGDTATSATKLHIVSARLNNGTFTVQALPLDATGNYVIIPSAEWSATVGCPDGERTQVPAKATVNGWQQHATEFVICIDNSLSANGFASNCISMLPSIVPAGIAGTPRVMLFSEEQEYLESISDVKTQTPNGLASVYAALYSAVQSLSNTQSSHRVVILLTASDDQSSVATTASDIISRAKTTGTTVHIVRMASTTHGYAYNSIAALSGGRCISLQDDEIKELPGIVSQLMLSANLAAEVAVEASQYTCENVRLTLNYKNSNGSMVSDSIYVPITQQSYDRYTSTIVATFPSDAEADIREHYATLASLSEVMLEDTTVQIELTGHTSSDATGSHIDKSVTRASMVRDVLVAYGVSKGRIRTRGVGSARPLYYFMETPQHKVYNNRVEMRVLRADDLPYTITVDQTTSEDIATKSVAKWKQRGFKSYFDAILSNNAPAYKVHLWGFPTLKDAQDVSAHIAKEFNVKAVVD